MTNDKSELRKEFREYIKQWPEMDALGSADWWLDKQSELLKKILEEGEKLRQKIIKDPNFTLETDEENTAFCQAINDYEERIKEIFYGK